MIVRDVMQRDVVTVSPDMSVREVAQTLVRECIGGAPVTEGDGTVLGVVSASDVMRAAAREPSRDVVFVERDGPWEARLGDEEDAGVEDAPSFFIQGDVPRPSFTVASLVGDALDEQTALEVMTPAAFSVRADLPVQELAEFLVRGRIHRALVLQEGRLSGIVTSFDVLRAFAGIEEVY